MFVPTPGFLWRLLKETAIEWDRDNVSRLAAALAYYTLFSLAPVLVVAIAIAGFLFGAEAARGQIVGQIQGLIGRPGAELVEAAILQASHPGAGVPATILGLLALLIGATAAFGQLQSGLNHVWGVTPAPRGMVKSLVRSRIISFAMVVGTGFLLLVSLVLSAALEAFGGYLQRFLPLLPFGAGLLNPAFSFVVIMLLFAMIYVILPDAEVPWRHIWFGAAITSLLFTLGKHVIGVYLGNTRIGSIYGAAGALAILLIWVYYSAQIFYLGAELTQVYTRMRGMPIEPSPHASHIVRIRVKADSLELARELAERELAAAEQAPRSIDASGEPPKLIEAAAEPPRGASKGMEAPAEPPRGVEAAGDKSKEDA